MASQLAAPVAESTCPSKKKYFASEADGNAFHAANQSKYPQVPNQHAYAYEECSGWHLTAMAPGQTSLAKVNYPVVPERQRAPTGETKAKVMELIAKGMGVKEIAAQLGIDPMTVYYHIKGRTNKRTQPPPAQTLESISQEEKDLLAKLENLSQRKKQLIEAKRLKLVPCWADKEERGILITKESNRLALSLADCRELVGMLTEILTSPN